MKYFLLILMCVHSHNAFSCDESSRKDDLRYLVEYEISQINVKLAKVIAFGEMIESVEEKGLGEVADSLLKLIKLEIDDVFSARFVQNSEEYIEVYTKMTACLYVNITSKKGYKNYKGFEKCHEDWLRYFPQ